MWSGVEFSARESRWWKGEGIGWDEMRGMGARVGEWRGCRKGGEVRRGEATQERGVVEGAEGRGGRESTGERREEG